MEWSLQEWIDYFDEGCNFLDFKFNPFEKKLMLDVRVIDGSFNKDYKILFQSVASVYYNAGIGEERLDDICPEEYNWQVFEMAYLPAGIGNLLNEEIDEYCSNANFVITFNRMLLAIEAKKVLINSKEFDV